MNKKLMSIDDLYNFCMNNNFNHFSYDDLNYEICVQMPANGLFKKEESNKHKEGLRPFVAKAYHDKVNLNKSEIDPDVFKENTKSAPFRPILAHIVTTESGDRDFNAHDYIVEKDSDGNDVVVYLEQPVGVINGDFSFEYDEDQDVTRAILNGYLYEDYCQEAIDILDRRGSTDCSIELNIREMAFNSANKTLLLKDYYVGGLTMLGANKSPGMKGSNMTLKDFSVENNSMFSHVEINEKLIDTLEKLNATLEGFNIKNTDGKEEGIAMVNENFETEVVETEEVAEEVTETEEATVVLEEETTVEETVEEEMTEETPEETVVEVSEEMPEESEEVKFSKVVNKFEKSIQIVYELSHEDIRGALYALLQAFEVEQNDWFFISNVFDDRFVCENWDGTVLYGCRYSKDGSNVSLEGDFYKLYKEILTTEEKATLDEMRSNYSAIQTKLSAYEKAELDAQKATIFEDASYANFLENDEFKTLIADKDKYSVEELKEKAELAFAKCVKQLGSFSRTEEAEPKKPSRHTFVKASKDTKKRAYGNIFADKN